MKNKQKLISKNHSKNHQHFANHLKDSNTMVDESIEWIEKVFQIEATSK
jgi:hypothetical protein